jgi:hypothetical protein
MRRMPIRETDIDVSSLAEGRPRRADMVVHLRAHDGAVRLVARDPVTGRFVRLAVRRPLDAWPMPGVPDDAAIRPFGLSLDGSRLLVADPHAGGYRLCSLELASGAAVPLPAGIDADTAAFAPDGRRVAALHQDDDSVAVTVLDTDTDTDTDAARRRVLWSAEGTVGDPILTWSPDGRFLAVNHLDPDDSEHTVVMDDAGTLVADLPETAIVGSSWRAWTGEHDLLLVAEVWGAQDGPLPIVLLDPASGDRREVRQRDESGVLGALDGRLLRPADNGRRIESTAFDGSDPRPVVDAGPAQAVSFFDAVPGSHTAG